MKYIIFFLLYTYPSDIYKSELFKTTFPSLFCNATNASHYLQTCEINKETIVFSEIVILKSSLVEIDHSYMLYDHVSTIWIIA